MSSGLTSACGRSRSHPSDLGSYREKSTVPHLPKLARVEDARDRQRERLSSTDALVERGRQLANASHFL